MSQRSVAVAISHCRFGAGLDTAPWPSSTPPAPCPFCHASSSRMRARRYTCRAAGRARTRVCDPALTRAPPSRVPLVTISTATTTVAVCREPSHSVGEVRTDRVCAIGERVANDSQSLSVIPTNCAPAGATNCQRPSAMPRGFSVLNSGQSAL